MLYGLSPSEFWNLSWYELSLYQLKYQMSEREKANIQEVEWSRWRILYTQIANAMRKSGTPPLRPDDLFKLSYDKDIAQQTPDTTKSEILKEAKRRLGSKFKFNGKQQRISENGGVDKRQRSTIPAGTTKKQ